MLSGKKWNARGFQVAPQKSVHFIIGRSQVQFLTMTQPSVAKRAKLAMVSGWGMVLLAFPC